jgi:RHS repeat-associated protein
VTGDEVAVSPLADAEVYNYFRDYDPGVGRYTESDPTGLAAGLNTYLYALAEPLMLVDPDGLDVCHDRYPPRPARARGKDPFVGIAYSAGWDSCKHCNRCRPALYWNGNGPGHGAYSYYRWIEWHQTNDADCCCVPVRNEGPHPPMNGYPLNDLVQ